LRKTASVAAAFLSAFLVIAMLSGCNDSERKARQYIENAREKYKAVAQELEKLKKLGESSLNATPEDVAAMKKNLVDMAAVVDEINKSAQAVRSEFEKVLELDDVGRFKEFARLEIEKLGLVDKQAGLLKDITAVAVKAMDAYTAGQPLDQAAIDNETKPISEELGKVTGQISELSDKATKLAEELNI
jgi:peptidoglycan hydrolase CwlO-like protein